MGKFLLAVVMFSALAARAAEAEPAKVDAKALYKGKCASCHGQDGKGNPAMAKMFKVEPAVMDLTGKTLQAKKDEDLTVSINKGKGKMPAYGEKLKADEVKSLVGMIRGLSPAGQVAKGKAAKGEASKPPSK